MTKYTLPQLVWGICLLLSVSGCNKYLNIVPDSNQNVRVEGLEQIADLLTAAYPGSSYNSFLEARTDNVSERFKGVHNRLNEYMYYWEDEDEDDLDTPLRYWNSCYHGIAQANQALQELSEYSPKDSRVRALYGEAFLLRAYLHFMLVNIWAETYKGEKSHEDMGIPYVTQPEKVAFQSYDRGTVYEVYEMIEKDLKRGISLIDDRYYKNPKFHFNKRAAYAFASRFYLYKGDWEAVKAYSDFVLGFSPMGMLRNWEKYRKGFQLNHEHPHSVYVNSNEEPNLLLTTVESRQSMNLPEEKYGLTDNVVERIYNIKIVSACGNSKFDLSMSHLILPSPAPMTDGRYIAKFDRLSFPGSSSLHPTDVYVTNVLFSTDEVMLNRIEAMAMLRQYHEAINELKQYMLGKYNLELPTCFDSDYLTIDDSTYSTYTPFYGLTVQQLAMVKIITDFRQKEFMHEGLRWFDIRRFQIPVRRSTKYALHRPLSKQDYRKVLQIPSDALKLGLKPNPRDNFHQQPLLYSK